MKLWVDIPIERIAKLFMAFRPRTGKPVTLTLRKGARYAVAGELFEITEVYASTVLLRPINPHLKLVRVG